MLTANQIALIKASVPFLEEHGLELTTHFYRRMLEGNPELKNVFNQAHQMKGEQQMSLAVAVLAYAKNIENPSVLAGAVRRIAQKHCTIGIRPEQYAIVGRHLIASLGELLGEAATPELVDAWTAAYQQLADLLIATEQKIYDEQANVEGGWSSWRPMRVANRVEECRDVVSFYLEPADGGPLPAYAPGQYVSVRTFVKELGLVQPRQYTISQASGTGFIRITVKRIAGDTTPEGRMSNHLHKYLKTGDVIDVSAPTGDFTIDVKAEHPAVFIAAGIGITPMVPMIETLSTENPLREVHFIYSTQNSETYPLRTEVERALSGMPNAASAVFFTKPLEKDRIGVDYNAEGRISVDELRNFCQNPDADFYLCGPIPFMKSIAEALRSIGIIAPRIHSEAFGTGDWE